MGGPQAIASGVLLRRDKDTDTPGGRPREDAEGEDARFLYCGEICRKQNSA